MKLILFLIFISAIYYTYKYKKLRDKDRDKKIYLKSLELNFLDKKHT